MLRSPQIVAVFLNRQKRQKANDELLESIDIPVPIIGGMHSRTVYGGYQGNSFSNLNADPLAKPVSKFMNLKVDTR